MDTGPTGPTRRPCRSRRSSPTSASARPREAPVWPRPPGRARGRRRWMTDTDTPSGGTSAAGAPVAPGRPDEQALAALPDKVRVHALARVVGTSSRELLAVLARIGVPARSAQSSVDRDVVARVIEDVFPTPGLPPADPLPEASPATRSDDVAAPDGADELAVADPSTGEVATTPP